MKLAGYKVLKEERENWKLVWFFNTKNYKQSEESKEECSNDMLK